MEVSASCMECVPLLRGTTKCKSPYDRRAACLFRVQEEAQCGWNSLIRGVGNQIRDVARG